MWYLTALKIEVENRDTHIKQNPFKNVIFEVQN